MITPFGATASSTLEGMESGRPVSFRTFEEFRGTPFENVKAALLPDYDAAKRLGGRKMLKFMSEAAEYGAVAAHEAVADSRVKDRYSSERIGIFAGTGLAAASVADVLPMIEESFDDSGRFSAVRFGSTGIKATNPLLSFRILANMPPCLVSIIEKVKGPNSIFTPWEGQTAAAIREACRAVENGECDAALAGGADNPAHPATVVYLKKSGLLGETEWPSPGAAYLVIERFEDAERTGVKIRAAIESLKLSFTGENADDPLSEKMGRSFAAAPAILLALAAMKKEESVSVCGVDGQRFTVCLRGIS
jgi:3-oxoacyl-(acyl-carrier-protein) synthase